MSRLASVGAGLILLFLALPAGSYGLYNIVFAVALPCQPTAPICRGGGTGAIIIGAVAVGVAVVHASVGIGVMLHRRRAIFAGLALSLAGAVLTAYVALTALQPLGYTLNDEAGLFEPTYNQTSITIAAGVVPYSVALVLLAAYLMRARRDEQPSPDARITGGSQYGSVR